MLWNRPMLYSKKYLHPTVLLIHLYQLSPMVMVSKARISVIILWHCPYGDALGAFFPWNQGQPIPWNFRPDLGEVQSIKLMQVVFLRIVF